MMTSALVMTKIKQHSVLSAESFRQLPTADRVLFRIAAMSPLLRFVKNSVFG